MTSRRLFLTGTTAVAITTGAVALNLPVAAQRRVPADTDPLRRELRRQLRSGMMKLNEGRGEGARQAAATIRIWASTFAGAAEQQVDTALRQIIRQRGRTYLLYTPINHAEMQKLAEDLGFPLHLLPPHQAPDPTRRERALQTILAEGMLPGFERAAQELEAKGDELDRRAPAVRSIAFAAALRACEIPCDAAESTGDVMEIYCAAALIFPVMAPACEVAAGAYLSLLMACYGCRLAFCGTPAGC